MAVVHQRHFNSFEEMLSAFKKRCAKQSILREARERMRYFDRDKDKRRRATRKAKIRDIKNERYNNRG